LDKEFTPEEIARYAIPIALAWKTLEPKNKDFNSTNLLPNKVIENQKYSKIAWHGYLIIAATIFFAFTGLVKNLELKHDISTYERKNYSIERVLIENQILIDRLNEIRERIDTLQESLDKVDRIIGNKNQWNYILDALSTTLNKNRLSWLSDITSNSDGLVIEGFTTNRRAVLALSKLFPRSRITSVSKMDMSKIISESAVSYDPQEINIWNFNISINYPDPKSWQEIDEEKVIEKSEKEMNEEVEETNIEEIKEESEFDVVEDVTEETSIQKVERVPDKVNEKYHSILSLYFSGKTKDAYNQFREFVEKYPDHKMAYYAKYLIGECSYLMGNYQEARDILEQVYKVNGSKSPDALIVLGNCSEEENDLDTAIQYWNTLIEKYPNNDLSKIARYKIDKIKGR